MSAGFPTDATFPRPFACRDHARERAEMWRSVCAGVAATLGVAVAAFGAPAQAEALRIHTRDGPRDTIVLAAAQAPAPSVIVLHGAINSASWTVRRFGFAEAAAARGFTAVFPEGINWKWNDGREDQPWKADDVAFLRQLVG